MTPPDIINGTFESVGGLFTLLSIRKLYQDKLVRGVHWMQLAFISLWGYWNLFYYPNLGQWMSFFGAAFLVTTNTIWLLMMGYYINLERCNGKPTLRSY